MLAVALGAVGLTNRTVRDRLKGIQRTASATASSGAPIVMVRNSVSGFSRFFASRGTRAKIERSVLLAGRPSGWTLRRILIAKLVFTMVGLLLFAAMISAGPSLVRILAGLTMVTVAYFAPDIIVKSRAEARQESIQQELPDVLDQVTISIESGLGFEAAFARIGDRRSGPLAEEIVRTVQDMRLGMGRREAYQALADRTDVDDLRRFVKSIVQAEQYGVSVASVVRTQAAEIRLKRRARAEGRALKVPVKILFPLLVCILPVLFIVVLTPAIINISTTLRNG